MKTPYILLLSVVSLLLGSCSNLNLVEQLAPEDRRVPIAIPPKETPFVYEYRGAFYIPITIAMAKEDMPLISSGLSNAGMAYCSYPRYIPDKDTAKVYLFRLTRNEIGGKIASLPRTTQPSPSTAPDYIAHEAFPYKQAKRHRLTNMNDYDNIMRPVSTGWNKAYRVWIPDSEPYPVGILPIVPGTRSLTNRLAYGPLWIMDAAGNIVLKGAEITMGATCGAVMFIPAGILYLCGQRIP